MSLDNETQDRTQSVPNELESHWIPFTPNREFKKAPRLVSGADGMYYTTPDSRRILDATAGLWCVNAGHCRKPIVEAIQTAAGTLDYAPHFQFGHPSSFKLASEISMSAPEGLDYVFFGNSGSEAVDSALKMALAYQRAIGEGTRTRFIGRERGYHGVGFGGISVGGMVANRKQFATQLPNVDHLRATYSHEHQAFTKGQPEWGAHLAEDLERLVALHDASTIAAVIVEPMAGSTGVLPPPKGYLERLREIASKHGILLIFDEVICGFGRLGASFAAERFGVTPDLITFAKGVTSGTVPLSGVIAHKMVYESMMEGPEHLPEFLHGYTYSAHPLGVAAGLATIKLYRDEGLYQRAAELEPLFADAVHSLKDAPGVTDIRTLGLAGAIDLESREGAPGERAFDAMRYAFHELDIMIRITGDTIALSPPLIVSEDEIGVITEKVRNIIGKVS